jgi:hypothetical protein
VIIGGLLFLSLMKLNGSYTNNAYLQQTALTAQTNVKAVSDVIDYDFRKIGYRRTGTKIITADTSTFTFWSDIDNNGSVDSVRYFLSSTSTLANTPNPNDRILYRLVNSQSTAGGNMGVIRFRLTYYDSLNAVTSTLSAIRAIKVQMTVQSPYPINGEYSTAYWEALFRPRSL